MYRWAVGLIVVVAATPTTPLTNGSYKIPRLLKTIKIYAIRITLFYFLYISFLFFVVIYKWLIKGFVCGVGEIYVCLSARLYACSHNFVLLYLLRQLTLTLVSLASVNLNRTLFHLMPANKLLLFFSKLKYFQMETYI